MHLRQIFDQLGLFVIRKLQGWKRDFHLRKLLKQKWLRRAFQFIKLIENFAVEEILHVLDDHDKYFKIPQTVGLVNLHHFQHLLEFVDDWLTYENKHVQYSIKYLAQFLFFLNRQDILVRFVGLNTRFALFALLALLTLLAFLLIFLNF